MGTAVILLSLLIIIIVLPSPSITRLVFAGVVVMVVLVAIAAIWRRNVRLERAESSGPGRA